MSRVILLREPRFESVGQARNVIGIPALGSRLELATDLADPAEPEAGAGPAQIVADRADARPLAPGAGLA